MSLCLTPGVLPLDQLRGLPSGEPPWESGVYFLWHGPELLYIGMSKYLPDRLHGHEMARNGLRKGKKIPFTKYTFFVMKTDSGDGLFDQRKLIAVSRTEARYINAYLPPFNDLVPPCY